MSKCLHVEGHMATGEDDRHGGGNVLSSGLIREQCVSIQMVFFSGSS